MAEVTGPKVNVECPHCGEMFAQSLIGLVPGLRRACPKCGGSIRYTARDIRHLVQALRRSRGR